MYVASFGEVKQPSTGSNERKAEQDSSGTSRTNKKYRTNKNDKYDTRERKNEGFAARSMNSADALGRKITPITIADNYILTNLWPGLDGWSTV